MGEALLKVENNYTYSDYVLWNDNNRYEIIDGVPYMMSPAPLQIHQEISRELLMQLANFLKDKPCEVFHAPFDVRLDVNHNDNTVCQPDLLVVCDLSKLDGKCCNGAPDFVIEILSPSSIKYDRVTKFNKYLSAGVREYWIVDPHEKIISAYILKDGQYIAYVYDDTDTNVPVRILDGCEINLQDVFYQ